MAVTSQLIERGLRRYSDSKFALAADLGQSNDPTAICVMEHIRSWDVTYKGKEQPAGETFDVRYLQRLPLGLSYVEQTQEIARLMGRPPLSSGCTLALDDSGVGRAVSDIVCTAGLKPIRITITAGDAQTAKPGNRWHVPKGVLISALDARLHTGELRLASELTEAAVLREELRDFRRHVSAAGRFSYDARTGKHDDLVLAVALALWVFTGKPKYQTPVVGKVSFIRKEKR